MTRPGADVPLRGWPLLALRLGATVLLADLSFRLVETPVRRLGFRRWLRGVVQVGPPGHRRPAGLAAIGAMVVAGAGVVAVLVSHAAPMSDIEQSLRAGQEAIARSASSTPAITPPRRSP